MISQFKTETSDHKCSYCGSQESVRVLNLSKRINEVEFNTNFHLCIYCRRKLWETLGNSLKRSE